MLRFDGKVVIVTGGSLGIGAAAAAASPRQGGARRHRQPRGRSGGGAVRDASRQRAAPQSTSPTDVAEEADVQAGRRRRSTASAGSTCSSTMPAST